MARSRLIVPLGLLVLIGCAPAQTTPPVGGASTAPTATPSAVESAATASATPVASPTAAGFALTGLVWDDKRAAVQGATVTASLNGQAAGNATTAADGGYSIMLPAGAYDVTATKDGMTTRTQHVTVSGATTLGFGTDVQGGANAYFLSDSLEIQKVDVKEDAPGGPLTMAFTMSEPLSTDAQRNFQTYFALDAGSSVGTKFLQATPVSEQYLETTSQWDAAGKVFTFKYNQPYLASGPGGNVSYTAYLHQEQLDTKDPVTREQQWQDLHITDAAGNPLGKGRVAYAFWKDPMAVLDSNLLINFQYGYYTDERRWNLTHTSTFSFQAATDTTLPQLLSVSAETNRPIGDRIEDVVELHFNKPMRAAKSVDDPTFTRLDTDTKKHLVAISVSKNDNGSQPSASSYTTPTEVEFSKTDPNLVLFHYVGGAFKDQHWIEVTTLSDMLDPAGNAMDPAHSRVSGPVTGT